MAGHTASGCRGSQRLLPGPAQAKCTVYDADETVGLRVIAPQGTSCRVNVLREQPEWISPRKQRREMLTRFIFSPDRRQCIDIPERTDHEGSLWRTKIIVVSVAEQQITLPQLLSDRLYCCLEPRVCRG